MTENEKNTSKSIDIVRKRFSLAAEAESENRLNALDDIKFKIGEQWPSDLKNERSLDGRPCLVINRIPQFIRQITNDQRQNRPSLKISPFDDNSDIDTAKIIQGLVRNIEYTSRADIAYDTAFGSAVTNGFGFFRVVTDYCDPMSFDQEILIKKIRDPFSVYLDPFSSEPDGSDAEWGFVFENISKDEFQLKYPNAELSQMSDWTSLGDRTESWVQTDGCRIAEYFFKDYKRTNIVLLNNGRVVEKDKLSFPLPAGITIIKERIANLPTVRWQLTNGIEILEEREFLSRWIPIIPVYGDETVVDGKRVLEGVIRQAKDSQRMYNYWASLETETIALSPRAPYLVAEGQIDKEQINSWKTANRKNHAFLVYKAISAGGQLVGAPQRNVYEPAIQAITTARLQAADDLKATTGIYDSSLGNQSNESSGIAIQRRKSQSQTSNFHYIDNLTRSLRHAGNIVIDLIPKIYDTARTVRIIGIDDQQEIVKINQQFQHNGKDVYYNLTIGKYDVVVQTGPSYATKREEAVTNMLDLTRAYPQMAQFAGDLMVRNMDWPGAQEIADRLKKTLPPGIAEDKNKPQQLPPEIQNQMQQMSQMIDQLTGELNKQNELMNSKTMELESRERIEFAKMEVDLKKELLKQQGQSALETFRAELDMINRRLQLVDINEPIDEEFNESGPEQSVIQDNQQPTGGLTPGQNNMGDE